MSTGVTALANGYPFTSIEMTAYYDDAAPHWLAKAATLADGETTS